MERSGHDFRGRDGCRVPMPWSGAAAPFGFGPPGSTPWLPQPTTWGGTAVEAQQGDPTSTPELYRAALRIRRTHPGLTGEELRWLPGPPGVLFFEREDGFRCAVNIAGHGYRLPGIRTMLVASAELVEASSPGMRRRGSSSARGRVPRSSRSTQARDTGGPGSSEVDDRPGRRPALVPAAPACQAFGGAVVPRTTRLTARTSRSGGGGSPAISATRRWTARIPVSISGW